ncbi:WD40/YVTN/BNR-like repeat-containing protein [Herbaspirillum lusitanum]|uniref:WD40/YVTN/BNR-like repeat-containing protein n=1 Tax=Herbaspirillum lusitanum TaxID=213312 RepID=UPI00138A448F|nr:YCF48-related protein [Herbaspirillum lusitanum]
MATLLCSGPGFAAQGESGVLGAVAERPALKSNTASRSVMIGEAFAGKRIVAVGERGVVLLSDDGGKAWAQATVPTSVTLTAVQFPNARNGWAVGHAGVILHSEDGGGSWRKQLDGDQAAKLILEFSEKYALANAGSPVAKSLSSAARQFMADGADKPFLDVFFINDRSGFVVGAFGLALKTEDGGATWQPFMQLLNNDEGSHLYSIKASGGRLVIAGERGFLAISNDAGKSFLSPELPYKGSLFAASVLPSGTIVVAGLKGNMFYADPGVLEFRKTQGGQNISYNATQVISDGRLIAMDQAGHLWISSDNGRSISLYSDFSPAPSLNSILQVSDGSIVGAGFRGMTRLEKKTNVNTGNSK